MTKRHNLYDTAYWYDKDDLIMCSMLMCAYTSYDINLDNYRFVCVCVFVCFFFHLYSSTCCFPSLSCTQTVRNSDTYSINCQHNQRQYVRTLTSNTTNTAERQRHLFIWHGCWNIHLWSSESQNVARWTGWLWLSCPVIWVLFLGGTLFPS